MEVSFASVCMIFSAFSSIRNLLIGVYLYVHVHSPPKRLISKQICSPIIKCDTALNFLSISRVCAHLFLLRSHRRHMYALAHPLFCIRYKCVFTGRVMAKSKGANLGCMCLLYGFGCFAEN